MIVKNKDKFTIKGFKHECGHYCGNSNKEYCCRCQNPKNGYRFLDKWSICKICWGTMRKHVDGFYFQKCPHCEKITETTHKGRPVLAPLAGCGCKKTREEMKHLREENAKFRKC